MMFLIGDVENVYQERQKYLKRTGFFILIFFFPSRYTTCQCNFLAPEEMLILIERWLGIGGDLNCHFSKFCRNTSFVGCETGPNIVICACLCR